MIWRGCVTTSVGGDVTPERGKGGDDANWTDTNLIRQKKIKKNNVIDSSVTNRW
jgi:hypothetical protein